MKSPFPGMDPFIESCGLWGDFHDDLISEIKRALAQSAPEHYVVRTGERSYLVLVEEEGKGKHGFVPDVSITTTQGRKKPSRKKGGGTAVAELDTGSEVRSLQIFIEEEHHEAFVEIYETTPEQRLVTCIEVLSPSNKRPNSVGREEYLRKRQSIILEGVNLVEIDLLRVGKRMPMRDPWPECPYSLLVARPNKERLCNVWPAYFHTPLSKIPVPLVQPDPDLMLDLQPMIEAIYQRSRYSRSIDYGKAITPPLGPEESEWLKKQLLGMEKKK